jgi:hypothetical protein
MMMHKKKKEQTNLIGVFFRVATGAILERLRLSSTNECPRRGFIARGSEKRREMLAGFHGGKFWREKIRREL